MSLSYISDSKYIDKIEKLYLNAFPKEERFPFWILKECSKENNSDLYAILDDKQFIGMCYIVNCGDYYYLMYLAVESKLRNKKYGSEILKDLKERYKILFLSIDIPINEVSIKRKNFYLRNGFYDMDMYYKDTDVYYEVLCTNKNCKITSNIIQKRYTNMTDNPKLLNVISNTFNTGVVNFKKIREKET